MSKSGRASRERHLQDLKIAEIHARQGRKLIARQQQIARRLSEAGGWPTTNANALLKALEDTQEIFERHVEVLTREIAQESRSVGIDLCQKRP